LDSSYPTRVTASFFIFSKRTIEVNRFLNKEKLVGCRHGSRLSFIRHH